MKMLLKPALLRLYAYVSGDEVERAEARELPYEHVVGHPREVRPAGKGQVLVVDGNHPQFGDRDAVLDQAQRSTVAGAVVGIHTYDADESRLAEVASSANVIVARTHAQVLEALEFRFPRPVAVRAA